MRRMLLGVLFLALAPVGHAQSNDSNDLSRLFGRIFGSSSSKEDTSTTSSSLTTSEIDAGLREALKVGTRAVASQLGQTDGYYGDPQIRIPLPGTYRTLQSNLSKIGASGPLDDLELRMNRAAEAAVPQAKDLIIDAISEMTIEDAVDILNGGDTAATTYLRRKTETRLREAFTPYVEDELSQAGAFSALETVASRYGAGGLTSSMQTDLTSHAVDLGLDGMFYYVAEQEKEIREDPLGQSSKLLQRVFGNRD